jgi:glycerol-3-phosphate cytidylyltransferase
MLNISVAKEVIKIVCGYFNCAIWGGTLLGIIRENRILPYDHDIDFIIKAKDFKPLPKQFVEYRRATFEDWMITKTAKFEHGNIGYLYKNTKVGIHILHDGHLDDPYGYYTRYPGELVKVPNQLSVIEYQGYKVPKNPDLFLEFFYSNYKKVNKNYIGSAEHLKNIQKWLVKKPNLVYCDGVWDQFHYGHRQLLHKAKNYGEVLAVGVKSDRASFRQKGKKPLQNENLRLRQVSEIAHHAFIYDESIAYGDIFIHGNDWCDKLDRTSLIKELKEKNIELLLLPRTPNISSSDYHLS